MVTALENKEQLIRFRVHAKKVQQLHKWTDTNNDGWAIIHWFLNAAFTFVF